MDDSETWEMAMQSEYNSILANKTWDLTLLPEDKQALPCKWVYKKKYIVEDLELKYKSRLVLRVSSSDKVWISMRFFLPWSR